MAPSRTGSKSLEREYKDLSSLLFNIVESIPMYFFVKDTGNDFRYIYASPMMDQVFKQQNSDAAGKTDFDLFADPTVAKEFRNKDTEVLQTGKMQHFVEQMVDPGGTLRSIDTMKLLVPREGKAPYLLGMSWDITAQVKIEEQLRNTYTKLAQACKTGLIYPFVWNIESPIAIFTLIQDNQICYEEVTYKDFCTTIHSDDLQPFEDAREAFALGRSNRLQTSFRSKYFTDTFQWYELTCEPDKSNKDGERRKAMGVMRNISSEKQSEKKLRDHNKSLALCCQAGKIYPWTWDLIEDTAEISIATDGNIQQISLNHKDFLDTVHPEDIHLYNEIIKEFILGNTTSIRFNFRCNYFGGEYIWFEKIGEVSEYDENGNPFKSMGILRDITADKHQEADRRAKLVAEESDRMKSAFIANMSHEIRTPLNAIVGFSSLLAESDSKEEKLEYLNIIENSNEFLLQLIGDILDISKIEAGKMEFFYSTFRLNEIFAPQEQAFALRVKPGVKVLFENNGDDYSIISEKTRFTQVITNFLSNAIKFTTSGTIRFGYRLTQNGIYGYVSDTGSGIKKELLPTIFNRFVKLDNFKQGTGLGLSICKTIISTLKGEIGVNSEIGKGSTFWFTIPCSPQKIE